MLTSKVAVLKSHHGISVKCSEYRDTGPTDPSLVITSLPVGGSLKEYWQVWQDLGAKSMGGFHSSGGLCPTF